MSSPICSLGTAQVPLDVGRSRTLHLNALRVQKYQEISRYGKMTA
jgi:hypothetical protein